MKTTDRALLGIVAGIVVLVLAAVGVALTRSEPTYRDGSGPEDVAHNYLLALFREDYDRAYGYLSPGLMGYPAATEDFRRQVRQEEWLFGRGSEVSVNVLSSEVDGEVAIVQARQQRFYASGPFDSGTSTDDFELTLRLEQGEWKLVNGELYFLPCWRDNLGYPCKN